MTHNQGSLVQVSWAHGLKGTCALHRCLLYTQRKTRIPARYASSVFGGEVKLHLPTTPMTTASIRNRPILPARKA